MRHVVHRDIKPRNVLVAGGDDDGDHRVLKITMSLAEPPPYGQAGTLRYEAPEMLLQMPEYDALVDTWSLGCVMAELVAGRPLFTQRREEAQLVAIFHLLGVPDGAAWPEFSATEFARNGNCAGAPAGEG
ncbi:hypothetical protein ACP4OV_008666 [Aristida adscensionis]